MNWLEEYYNIPKLVDSIDNRIKLLAIHSLNLDTTNVTMKLVQMLAEKEALNFKALEYRRRILVYFTNREKEFIKLRYGEQLLLDNISQLLGISERTVMRINQSVKNKVNNF